MGEFINREALMQFPIRIDHYDKVNGSEDFVMGIESVLEFAEHLPTVDVVEVKHGEWIQPYVLFSDRVCSACGYKTTKSHALSYCPNCGAKMNG